MSQAFTSSAGRADEAQSRRGPGRSYLLDVADRPSWRMVPCHARLGAADDGTEAMLRCPPAAPTPCRLGVDLIVTPVALRGHLARRLVDLPYLPFIHADAPEAPAPPLESTLGIACGSCVRGRRPSARRAARSRDPGAKAVAWSARTTRTLRRALHEPVRGSAHRFSGRRSAKPTLAAASDRCAAARDKRYR